MAIKNWPLFLDILHGTFDDLGKAAKARFADCRMKASAPWMNRLRRRPKAYRRTELREKGRVYLQVKEPSEGCVGCQLNVNNI